jgi:hypothetical protein
MEGGEGGGVANVRKINLTSNFKTGPDPCIMMEDIVDMLKLLNYEQNFCKQKYDMY